MSESEFKKKYFESIAFSKKATYAVSHYDFFQNTKQYDDITPIVVCS